MARRFIALVFTCTVFLVFILFGSLRLQWNQSHQVPLWLNVSLQFKLPQEIKAFAKQPLEETLQSAFLLSFGEPSPGEEKGSFSKKSQNPFARTVTFHSVIQRIQEMVQIESAHPEISEKISPKV
jgi:hypothetical protein